MYLNEVLLKAAKRDTSKLVQVQRTVTRGGKTFIQKFWVNPNQVKSTDKVIGNSQNLLPKIGSVPKPPKGVLSQPYLDSIMSNKTKVIEYLKECGVTWKENHNPGINWMRAMVAAKAALNNQSTNNVSSSTATTTTNQTVLDAMSMLDQSALDDFNKCSNGREKVVVLKKHLGQDGCIKFAKLYGVTWNEHDHKSINNMRMSMALQSALDADAGTTSTKVGGAPKGNQNAKKDTHIEQSNELPIPPDATPRMRNIISLINGISNIDELNVYTGVGMIPEDDVAKSFIYDKLSPKYNEWKHSSTKNGKGSSGEFSKTMNSTLKVQGISKHATESGFRTWNDYFRVSQILDPRKSISSIYSDIASRTAFGIHDIMNDIYEAFSTYATDDFEIPDTSIYTGNNMNNYPTNIGYTGWDSREWSSRFDENKDGFIRYLRHVADINPGTQSKVESMISQYKSMLSKVGYNHKLLINVLGSTYWNIDEFGTFPTFNMGIVKTPEDARALKETMEYQSDVIPKILRQLGYSDKSIVQTLLHNNVVYGWDSLTMFDEHGNLLRDTSKPKDPFTGKYPIMSIDLTKVINPETGEYYFDAHDSRILPGQHTSVTNRNVKDYILHKLTGDSLNENLQNCINNINALASISKEDFAEIHSTAMNMFGLCVQDINTKEPVTEVTYDILSRIHRNRAYEVTATTDDNPELDTILANLNFSFVDIQAKRKVISGTKRSKSCAINNFGDDYSGNFDYYYPTNPLQSSQYRIAHSFNSILRADKLTADELNDKINNQLLEAPVLTSDYLDHLSDFYLAECNNDPNIMASTIRKEGLFRVVNDGSVSSEFHPLKDVLYQASVGITSHIPKMRVVKNFEQTIAKRLNYKPYNDTTTSQHDAGKVDIDTKSDIRKARESALKSIHCTIAVEDESKSLQMRKDMLKNFDYDGVTHKKIYDGGNAGGDRRVLFNSRFFKINNSQMEEEFQDYQTKLGQVPDDATYYHGTSYGSAAGIIGVTGGWKFNIDARSGRMLGEGAYFGNKVGKIMPYASERAYSYLDKDPGTDADGVIILSDLLQGAAGERTICDPDSPSSGRSILGYETSVRNNKCIFAHHMVDVSCRSYGRNVKRDSLGNYLDNSGNITHDRYGKSVTMK